MPARQWDTQTWVADPRRSRAELGWEATIDLETGLRRFVDWLQTTPGAMTRYT
jgi:nucleoside-diphosphate-sugar epimerase